MPFADLEGSRIFFTDDGPGEHAMLLVHGFGCDSNDWNWQTDAFLHAGFRVIALDSRGHGHSATRTDRYDALACVEDIMGLLSHVGLDEVIAIGHSYGAIIASALAVEHPQVVRALVAVDPGHAADDETVALISQLRETMRCRSGLDAAVHAFSKLESERTSREIRRWHTRRLLATPPNVLAAVLGGMYQEGAMFGSPSDVYRYLTRRACPVLSVHASARQAELHAATFRDERSQAVSWADHGHWLHQEDPARFNHLVLTWLGSLDLSPDLVHPEGGMGDGDVRHYGGA